MLLINMKMVLCGRGFIAAVAALWLSSYNNAHAQTPGGPGPAGVSAALTKLFGKNTAFSAKGEMQVTDSSKHEMSFWPMDFSVLDKKIRVEIDLAQTRNKGVPPEMGAMLKQMGMSQVISIIRPDKGVVYVIYPDQRALLTMPLPKEDSAGSEKPPQITRTSLAKETIDGHPCAKNKVVVADANGQSTEAITWDASDLHDLPIQIQTQESSTTSLIRFKQVQFTPPAAASFEPPSGFTQYDSAEELKLAVMKKVIDNGSKK
jgi:hypothetical protein